MLLDAIYRLMQRPRRWATRVHDAASEFGATITWPVERLFSAMLRYWLRSVSAFERVEKIVVGFGMVIAWPVRRAWSLLVSAVALVVPATIRAMVYRRFVAWIRFSNWFAEASWELVEWLNLDAVVRWILWVTQPAWRPFAAIAGFLYAWLATRPYRQMAWGAPVLALLLFLGGASWWGLTWGRQDVEAHYRTAVELARDKKEFATVRLFEQKLGQLGAETKGADFRRALALADRGKLDDAYVTMKRLAPEEDLGMPAAHSWILVQLLGNSIKVPLDDRLRLAGIHLQHLNSLDIKALELDLLQGVYLQQTGKIEEAAAIFEPLISRSSLAAMQRMQINVQLKRLEEARRDARALRIHLQEMENSGERPAAVEYQAWAQAEQLLENPKDWSRIVRAWLAIDPQSKPARENVATLDFREFNEMLQSAYPEPQALAARLIEAAQLLNDPSLFEQRLPELYLNRKQRPAIEAMFAQLIETPDTPLPIVGAIGAAAAVENDVPLARRLLGRVVAENPKSAVAWNNYAWALSKEPDRDLPNALRAVNRSLEIVPDEFRFRETRGQIYIALGRWQEAIDDLELALNGMPDMVAIHASLAKAYDELGEAELAAIHRQQVQ